MRSLRTIASTPLRSMNASEAALTEKNSPNTQERRKNSKSSNLKRVNSSGSVEEDEKTPPQVLRERSVSEVLENKINVEILNYISYLKIKCVPICMICMSACC